jgi:hypothetical protein
MPLPDYSPRSDSFGNWYYGGFQMDSQVEAGYGANHTTAPTQADWETFLTAALGAENWTLSGYYYLRFANPYEEQSGVTSNSNYRFYMYGSQIRFNTRPSTGTPVVLTTAGIISTTLYNSSFIPFAVANQYGMWYGYGVAGATSGTVGSVYSAYMGWVKDPVFPTNTSERYRNLVAGTFTNDLNTSIASIAPATTSSTKPVFNSSITCSITTPGANVSDLCVLDPANNYLNIGSLYNSLFYPGTELTVGQIYRIPPASDPDGNTEQNIWLCAGQVYGWNGSTGAANAGYKLIRVWSNNIT